MLFFWIYYQFKFVFHLYPSLLTKTIHIFTRVTDTENLECVLCHVRALDLPHLKLSNEHATMHRVKNLVYFIQQNHFKKCMHS